MKQSPKKISLGFKIVFIITVVFFILFFAMLLVFGASATKFNDADLKGGIGDMFKYHFSDIKGLFTFNFHKASNVIYFSLSVLIYFFILIAVISLVIGIILMSKKKRYFIIPSLVLSVLVVLVFMFVATGTPKYWYIINQRAPFDKDKALMLPTIGVLLSSVLYVLAAYIFYFYSVFLMAKLPSPTKEESKPVEERIDDEEVMIPQEESELEEEEKDEEDEPIFKEEEPAVFEEVDMNDEPASKPVEDTQKIEDKDDLRSLLKELVRDIVRDEISRNNANQPKVESSNPVSGINGPLVVQYFNGYPGDAAPIQQPVKQEEKPQPQPEPEVKPQPEIKPQPVVKQAVKQEVKAPEEKKPIIRIPFIDRMLSADKEMQDNYNELKNEILSYGVNSRVSNSGDTFRLHRKTYVKITIAGLSLKLYFALNPDDYKDSTLPIQNAGHKGIYEEIPLVFKVKSGLSMRRCKQLIQDVFEKNGFEQGEIGSINWVEDLKNTANADEDD